MEQRQLLLAAVNYHKNIIMGILNNEYYYYFKTKNGVTTIVRWSVRINTTINRNYVELTPEQVEFYLAHPDASVEEVRNCQLYEPYVEPTPELEELRSEAKRKVKEAYYLKMGQYSELDIALAISSRICIQNLWLSQSACVYSTDEAKDMIRGFVQLGKNAKPIYEEGMRAIDNSMSEETISAAAELYSERLNEL